MQTHTHKYIHKKSVDDVAAALVVVVVVYAYMYGLNWRYLPFMSLEPNCVLKNLLRKLFEFCANDNNKIMRHSLHVVCKGAEKTNATEMRREEKKTNGDRTANCLFHLDGRSVGKQIH